MGDEAIYFVILVSHIYDLTKSQRDEKLSSPNIDPRPPMGV